MDHVEPVFLPASAGLLNKGYEFVAARDSDKVAAVGGGEAVGIHDQIWVQDRFGDGQITAPHVEIVGGELLVVLIAVEVLAAAAGVCVGLGGGESSGSEEGQADGDGRSKLHVGGGFSDGRAGSVLVGLKVGLNEALRWKGK